jgi:Leu/Phe-tRNA-protein transferase
LEKLKDKEYYEYIVKDMQNNYYWSEDWSEEFYVELAKAGFISTTYETKDSLVLLPELQFSYAVLDFEDLHISKKVKKLLKKGDFIFSIDTSFDDVLDAIAKQHTYNWLKGKYLHLLKNLHKQSRDDFKLISVELFCKSTNKLVAGEVGYIINKTYTSLSGFSSREKIYNNYGTLQLVLLAKHLQKNNFAFWNLGHPHMIYKQKLGCKIYKRDEFLSRYKVGMGED